MSDDKSLVKIDGNLASVAEKFLDKLEKACVYAIPSLAERFDFEEALKKYTDAINNDESLSAIEKSAFTAKRRQTLKEYINTHDIIKQALGSIKKDAKINLDEDWLSYFFDYAKNISNEYVQMMWAKILAEEANGDTSVQRQLIHKLSLMDAKAAKAFTNLCRITVCMPNPSLYQNLQTRFLSRYIPLIIPKQKLALYIELNKISGQDSLQDYWDTIPTAEELSLLQEIGFIQLPEDKENTFKYPYNVGRINHDFSGHGNRYKGTSVADFIVDYQTEKYKVQWKGDLDIMPQSIDVGFIQFTTVGEQLFKLLLVDPVKNFGDFLMVFWKTPQMEVIRVEMET